MSEDAAAEQKSVVVFEVVGGLCLGYGIAHVVVFYLLGVLVFESLGFKVLEKLSSGLKAEQVTNIILLGYILPRVTEHTKDSRRSALVWICAGAGLCVAAILLKLIK